MLPKTHIIPRTSGHLRHHALSLDTQQPFHIQDEGDQRTLHESHLLAHIPDRFEPMSHRFRKFPLSHNASEHLPHHGLRRAGMGPLPFPFGLMAVSGHF